MQAARGASLNSSDPDRHHRHHRSRRALVLFAVTAAVTYAIDLLTKTLALEKLQDEPPIQVVGDVLQLTLVRNPGAAFGLGTSYTVALSLIAVAAAVFVLFAARRLTSMFWAFGLGSLLGGVLGNLTDRVFRDPGFLRGHVVDFLQLPNWPVFNFSDVWINIAAGVIVVQAIRGVSHSEWPRDEAGLESTENAEGSGGSRDAGTTTP